MWGHRTYPHMNSNFIDTVSTRLNCHGTLNRQICCTLHIPRIYSLSIEIFQTIGGYSWRPLNQWNWSSLAPTMRHITDHISLLHHIMSLIAYTFRENRECVFIIIVQFMISADNRIRFGLQIALVCLFGTPSHYRHCANLSVGFELIKCLSDIFCRVCE